MTKREESLPRVNEQLPWLLRLALSRIGRLRYGRVEVLLPNGQRREVEGEQPGPSATLRLCSPRAMSRVLTGGELGFAEGFMNGDWDTPDLANLIYLLHLNEDYLIPQIPGMTRLARAWSSWKHRRRRNTRRGSRRNIAYHYDLGNDFYALWLDETWTYSSAVFDTPETDMAEAQRYKYQLLLDRLEIRPGDHILEIGCGWGGFARYAAQAADVRVTGITLSTEQLAFARERTAEAGLDERVDFRLQDYRDVQGQFDAVASIEMYEAVGEDYWPSYFRAIQRALKPGGRAAIQGITIDHAQFPSYRDEVDFIQRYIFPGGMLASPEIFERQAREQGLMPSDARFYGSHYAETLRRWHQGTWAARQAIRQHFDDRFLRMWRYYLAYCEAGFRSGNIDLMQITLQRA